MAPIDPRQQIAELRRRDRHHTISHARPQEPAAFQPLGEQAGALAVMSDHLQVAATATEAKQMTTQRVALQNLPDRILKHAPGYR